jgi:excisionase family DNA binding protein
MFTGPDVLLTVDEVATRIGQSRWTVYRKIATGQLPAVRLGDGRSALRVSEASLERWLYAEPAEREEERCH